eukprot:TRINITY_DN14960_c0_g1_i2.p2 TRINITY_DN14960_c0_g1~~TRINITY_DN14960_c0_g1_i2.p2  ORF type:complete len:141 (-),score=37.81 TRINITY_DN14960_c0_g1_i2:35-457(-)
MDILQELDNANLDYYSEKLNSIKKEYDEKWASSKSFLIEIKNIKNEITDLKQQLDYKEEDRKGSSDKIPDLTNVLSYSQICSQYLNQNSMISTVENSNDKKKPLQIKIRNFSAMARSNTCLLYTSPSPRDRQKSRMPSSA